MSPSITDESDENDQHDDSSEAIINSEHQRHNTDEDFSSYGLSRSLVIATIYASISGLLFGYQLGVTTGALHSLQSSLDLSNSQTESVTSIFFLGLMIASPFGGEACDRFGRRKCILYTDGVFIFASLILLFAPGINILLIGRFVSGCASGLGLVGAVSYLTELAGSGDHSHRGALVSTVEASVSLGFLIAYLTSYLLLKFVNMEESWRLLFGLGTGLLSGLQWWGMRKMPESPEWLAQHGFYEKAEEALRWIGDAITHELKTQSDDQNEQREIGLLVSLKLSISQYWRQILIIAFLAVAEQFSGHM